MLIKTSATPNKAINAISCLSETPRQSPLIHPFSHEFMHVCPFLFNKGQVHTYYVPYQAQAWDWSNELDTVLLYNRQMVITLSDEEHNRARPGASENLGKK